MKKKSFKDATKSLFLKYTVIPILALIVLFTIFTIVIFHLKAVYDAKQSGVHIGEKIENVYKTYQEEMERMISSSVVMESLQTHSDINLVYEAFYNFNNQQEVKSSFYLVDNQHVFVASTNKSNEEVNDAILDQIVPHLREEPNKLLTLVEKTSFSHGQTSSITLGKAVKQNNRIIGYLIYKLYEEDFQRLIFGEKTDIVVVTDTYNHIVVTSNEIVQGLMNKFQPEKITNSRAQIKNENYYMNQIKTEDGLFRIYTLNNTGTDRVVLILYILFIGITGLFLFVLLRILAEKMSSKNVDSIDKLLVAVSQLKKGDLTSYVDIDTGDEFETLANQYNIMLDSLNALVKRNQELSEIKKVNEMKILQSQFNPHFLFNVLETLRYTMISNVDKAQDIILSLSSLLRYSINQTVDYVVLEQDLYYTIDYLKLHQLRFRDRLHYEIDIPEEIQGAFVPKLLLQPIIENAIKYGYQRQTNLNILIKAVVKGECIVFTVEDDGGGIAPEKLNDIQRKIQNDRNSQIGIGLYNTHQRVRLQYGNDYGLIIHSVLGEGTTVQITIPYSKGGELHV
ncbi:MULTISPECIES: sensor histidine kinase [Gracilibacillus]|uniref:sensor histidine kinase n=1 Tax=Gracilibacillus TaxID=74385 RepID=UPI00098F8BDD|nr:MULTISPECIES: histidine kinase [Gracilibacillus]